MDAIRRIVWASDTRAGRVFDTVVMSVIVGGLVLDAVVTLEGLGPRLSRPLALASKAVTSLFVIEYMLRLATAPKRWRYVTSFYGIVDLVAILPTLLGLDLRALRAFRLFRLLRLLKITRAKALNRFGKALWTVKDEGLIFLFTTALVLYLAAAGIHHFEHEAQPATFGSLPESFWWAVTSLTTVGYGDAYPVTVGGRMFTAVILLAGIAIVAAPAGLVATAQDGRAFQHAHRDVQERRVALGADGRRFAGSGPQKEREPHGAPDPGPEAGRHSWPERTGKPDDRSRRSLRVSAKRRPRRRHWPKPTPSPWPQRLRESAPPKTGGPPQSPPTEPPRTLGEHCSNQRPNDDRGRLISSDKLPSQTRHEGPQRGGRSREARPLGPPTYCRSGPGGRQGAVRIRLNSAAIADEAPARTITHTLASVNFYPNDPA